MKPAIRTGLLVLALLAASPAIAGQFRVERDWRADGNGNYVHRGTGQVISESRYTDLVAREVYNKFNARAGYVPGYCILPDGR